MRWSQQPHTADRLYAYDVGAGRRVTSPCRGRRHPVNRTRSSGTLTSHLSKGSSHLDDDHEEHHGMNSEAGYN